MNVTAQRSHWVDYAKGIGIILVVYAHLLSSGYHSGLGIPERFFNLSSSIIYGFHMPLFFFLSGLFAANSLLRRGTKDYLLDKLRSILYPYLIWSIIQLTAEIVFSSHSRTQPGVTNLLGILYRPWGQFWFLYALFLMHLLYALFSRALGKYALPVLLLLSGVLLLYRFSTPLFAFFGLRVHFLFFMCGIAFKKQVMRIEQIEMPLWVGGTLTALLLGSGLFIYTQLIEPVQWANPRHPVYFLYLSALGIAAAITLSRALAAKNSVQFLRVLGMSSMPIYLAHMLVGVGIRIILLALRVENWIIHIAAGVFFALTIPVILQKISDALNLPYLFELPKKTT